MSHPTQTLRQPVVVVLGHVDSGKCVSGDTPIQLADGRIVEAEKVFEAHKHGLPSERTDGVVFEASGLEVLSVSPEGQVVPRKVSHVWKLRSDRLTEVQTRAGFSVRCTPEHKFLVMGRDGDLSYLEADRLRIGDHLVLPSKVPVPQRGSDKLKAEMLGRLSDALLLRATPSVNESIRQFSAGGRKALGERLGDDQLEFHVQRGYYRASIFRALTKLMGIPPESAFDEVLEIKFASPKRRASHKSPWIKLPKTEEELRSLAYLVGLLYGDGVASTGHLANTSPYIMDLFHDALRSAFDVRASRAWGRTSFIVSHKGGKTLLRFLGDAFDYPTTDKTKRLRVPDTVALMPDASMAMFLRGFFDAEGFVANGRVIGVGCNSKELMSRIPMLLSRFGCLSYFGKGSHDREVYISGREHLSAFISRIGFGEKEKALGSRILRSNASTCRVFDMTPIPGEFLRSVMDTQQVLWDRHFQLTSFEHHDRISKDVIKRIPSVVPSFGSNQLVRTVTAYATVQVTALRSLEGEFDVYDFTVEDYHNFLANNLIIHNTSFLDRLRGTAVQAREAGGITQEIGASFFPMDTLLAISGSLLDRSGAQLRIPGLLVIDTPGHEIFSNLRMRGGSAADIAILLVDVNKGLENQTIESIEILRQRKVPFLVALNKIDMISGWRKDTTGPLANALKHQPPEWNDELEERLYNVVGGLSRLGFNSDAYYRVKDFRKQVAIVPISARFGIGMPEIMAVLIGLAQQYLAEKLVAIDEKGRARGIILELQEEVGIGETANIILTDGKLSVGDRLVLVRRDGAIESRVKALFMPKPLDEMRDPRDKFTPVQEVYSAAGVKLVAPDLSGVVPGTSVISFRNSEEFRAVKAEAEKDLTAVVTKTDVDGVVVKAGNIGGLEALVRMLEQRQIPVRAADIGDISRNDIVEAEAVAEHDPYLGAIIGFDVKVIPDAKEESSRVQIITSDVIYDAVEGYVQWAAKKREDDQKNALSMITAPAKIKALPGMFFRRNDPAVFGVEVLGGKLKPKVRLMDASGVELGTVEQIQDNGKPVPEATMGMQVAISVRGPTLGRQIKENDSIFTFPTSADVRMLRGKYAGTLGQDDEAVLEEIVAIRSAKDMMYGF